MRRNLVFLACALGFSMAAQAQSAGYFRQPSLHGETLVFTAEGDLWVSHIQGGNARRLTTHPAEESHAAISPDGQTLAFTASYHGNQEVHVMPIAGGTPVRVTYGNAPAWVIGWTAQGEILYSTQLPGGTGGTQRVIASISPSGTTPRVLPLADASDAVMTSDGRWVYFTRFGLSATNDNARGYRGGAISQLWRFDLEQGQEAERIGPQNVNLRRPMLHGNSLIVVADPEGRDVLARLEPASGQLTTLTQDEAFDVRGRASLSGDTVVYQSGADIRRLNVVSGEEKIVPLSLSSDFTQRNERWLETPMSFLEHARISADGERALVIARGRAVIASSDKSRRVDLGVADGTRISEAVFSPDRRYVFAISDASGEEEIWRYSSDGSTEAVQFTRDGETQRHGLTVSPDGKWLTHSDKRGRLWLLDIASQKQRVIDDAGRESQQAASDVAWSSDGKFVAFTRVSKSGTHSRLAIYSLDHDAMQWLSSDKYDSHSPAFSPDGKWLWFLSDREFVLANGSPWGDRNTGPFFDKRSKIYALSLQAANTFPFQSDNELTATSSTLTADKKEQDTKPVSLTVAWDGLAGRLFEVPVEAGNYHDLAADKDRLWVMAHEGRKSALRTLAFTKNAPKFETFAPDVAGFELAPKAEKVLLRSSALPAQLHLVKAGNTAPNNLAEHTVALNDWRLRIDPPAEWRQMFDDAWRMHRDHFYDANLRGVDWNGVKLRYSQLLPRVSDRLELDDLLAQMIGELGALHSQVRGGEYRSAKETAATSGLGATWSKTAEGWKIDRIYTTEAELPSQRGPLQAPGVDVREGDVILSINGRRVAEVANPSVLLQNTANQQVLIEVSRQGRVIRNVVMPVDMQREDALRYSDWMLSRQAEVTKASQGRIGYLHLRAMGPNDIASFVREFYAQIDRDGLIIDVRRNRGGNIDSWVIEKLLRRTWAFWQLPTGSPYGNMQQSFRGHLTVLTDALTYSDGETFAAGIKANKLGPVIGQQTAGAGVWLTDSNALVDRGRARVAEIPQYDMEGRWIIEGVGVVPDIAVDNLPHESFNGKDRQLDTAVSWLLNKLNEAPVPALKRGIIPPLD